MTLRYTVGQRLATMAPVRLRAATGGFLPPQLGGCALWLDPTWGVFTDTAATTPAGIGDAVAAWRDRAAGILFTQSTLANRPTLQALNGLPFIFGSGSQFLSATVPVYAQPLTWVSAINPSALTGGAIIWSLGGNAATYISGANQLTNFYGSTFAGPTLTAGTTQAVSQLVNGASSRTTVGSAVSTGNPGTNSGGTTAYVFDNGGGTKFNGYMGPLCLYSRGLSFAEESRVKRYCLRGAP